MDIAAMSMDLSAARLQQSVGISMTKKAMDTQEAQLEGLMDMVDSASPSRIQASGLGQLVDTTA